MSFYHNDEYENAGRESYPPRLDEDAALTDQLPNSEVYGISENYASDVTGSLPAGYDQQLHAVAHFDEIDEQGSRMGFPLNDAPPTSLVPGQHDYAASIYSGYPLQDEPFPVHDTLPRSQDMGENRAFEYPPAYSDQPYSMHSSEFPLDQDETDVDGENGSRGLSKVAKVLVGSALAPSHRPSSLSNGLIVTPGVQLTYSQTSLEISEDILSPTRDSFTVRDPTGAVIYKIAGSFSVHEHKTLRDSSNRELLHIREGRLKLRERIVISDGQNRPVLCVKEMGFPGLASRKAHAYPGGRPGGIPVLVILKNLDASRFEITTPHGEQVATAYRRLHSIRYKLSGQDSYQVILSPGVDPALMSMIIVTIDELWAD